MAVSQNEGLSFGSSVAMFLLGFVFMRIAYFIWQSRNWDKDSFTQRVYWLSHLPFAIPLAAVGVLFVVYGFLGILGVV